MSEKKTKKNIRLTKTQKKEIYKQEKDRRQQNYLNELKERSIVTLGSILLPIYVLFSSIIVGVGSVMYMVAINPNVVLSDFVNNPVGFIGSLGLTSISIFILWCMFAMYSFLLFVLAQKIVTKKPEKYKGFKILRWRKK